MKIIWHGSGFPIAWENLNLDALDSPWTLEGSAQDLILYKEGQLVLKASDLYRTVGGNKNFLDTVFSRKKKKADDVIDGTCGWGKDAISLGLLGKRVEAFEQSLIPYLFCTFALQYFFPSLKVKVHYDSFSHIASYNLSPLSWVYLDPLFADDRSGLSKKSLELLYDPQWIDIDPSARSVSKQNEDLIAGLGSVEIETLVIKQHRHAQDWIDNPAIVKTEKSNKVCRFDIYYVNKKHLERHFFHKD